MDETVKHSNLQGGAKGNKRGSLAFVTSRSIRWQLVIPTDKLRSA